jgi:hypothetical protein
MIQPIVQYYAYWVFVFVPLYVGGYFVIKTLHSIYKELKRANEI